MMLMSRILNFVNATNQMTLKVELNFNQQIRQNLPSIIFFQNIIKTYIIKNK
ncbi:hypothetical protein pb186bvf_000244 [Paramecium bursaria]